MTEAQLLKRIAYCLIDDDFIAIINNANVTPKVLFQIIDSTDAARVRYAILNSNVLDEDILNHLIKKTPTNSSDKMLEAILNCPKLTPKCLISFCNRFKTYNYHWHEWIMESSSFNESVALTLINNLSLYEENIYSNEVYIKLINHPVCNKNILLEIINKTTSAKVVTKILASPLADLSIKLEIVIKKRNLTEEDIKNFFNTPGITSENICRLIRKHNTDEIIDRALEFPEIDDKLYKVIIEGIYFRADPNDDEKIREILKRDISEDVLSVIIKETKSVDIIREVSKHPNASLRNAQIILSVVENYKEANRKALIEIVKQLKNAIIAKTYKVEKEENVTDMLRTNVEDGLSTMLWGPSGVGKSSRVFEVDPTATLLILKNGMLPEEVIGGKEPNGTPGQIYPPHWYRVLCEKCEREPDRQHILFIDEFTNVTDTIKNLVWEIIGNRLVNGHEEWPLPENCSIVVAGNRPEESSAVRIDSNGGVMPAPLHNRLDSMIEIQFDIDEWQKWALETDYKTGHLHIHPVVYAFCVANADKVMFTEYDSENVTAPFLTPRKWETLSKAIYKAQERSGENTLISEARIKSIIGDNEISDAFIEHYYRIPIDMEKIENGEYDESDFPTVEDKLYALGIVIANYEGDEIAIEDFINECLGEEYYAIYVNMKNHRRSILGLDVGGKTR